MLKMDCAADDDKALNIRCLPLTKTPRRFPYSAFRVMMLRGFVALHNYEYMGVLRHCQYPEYDIFVRRTKMGN
jgi:hypothetical protein